MAGFFHKVMFPLYRLGTFLEDVSTAELHIDRFQLHHLLVKFFCHLDNVWHRFPLANDKKNYLLLWHQRLSLYLLLFSICIGKTTHILL